jgi:hypothetical protein
MIYDFKRGLADIALCRKNLFSPTSILFACINMRDQHKFCSLAFLLRLVPSITVMKLPSFAAPRLPCRFRMQFIKASRIYLISLGIFLLTKCRDLFLLPVDEQRSAILTSFISVGRQQTFVAMRRFLH